MNHRLQLAAWFTLSIACLLGALFFSTHYHLDEELRRDRWDRSHPQFPGWVIHGSYTDEEVGDILGELVQVWLVVGVPILALSAMVGYLLAKRSGRPIRAINAALDALPADEMAAGISIPEKDSELAGLVGHINALLARARASYEDMADFSARVAHELRHPLTHLRMKVESAAPSLPPDFSEDIQADIHHLSQLVERSLLLAKAERGAIEPELQTLDLRPLLEDLLETYSTLAAESGKEFDWHCTPLPPCRCDEGWVRQIVHNLLANAIRHGKSQIRIRVFPSPGTQAIYLAFANDVPESLGMIPPGTGIGLRLVQRLACAMPGTRFKLRRGPRSFGAVLSLSGLPHQAARGWMGQ